MKGEAGKAAPVGLLIGVVFLAWCAGTASGILLGGGGGALLAAGFACLGVFLLARVAADVERQAVVGPLLLGGWAFTCALLLVAVGGIARPQRLGRDIYGLLDAVGHLLGSMAVAILVPAALIVAGLKQAASARPAPAAEPAGRVRRASVLPLLFPAGIFALWMFLMGGVMLAIRSPGWRAAALVLLAMTLPAIVSPLGALLHRAVLSRRTIAPPHALATGLEKLFDLTGVRFGRVLCLDPEYGSGRECLVLGVPWQPTLVVSGGLVERIAPGPLLALLAHEAAHVHRHHIARRLAWAAVLVIPAVAAATALLVILDPWLPRRFSFLVMFTAVFPAILLKELYAALVSRRHEAEADRYAVDVAGAEALLTGLEAVQGAGPPPDPHRRWTTHGTREERSARIRRFEIEARSVTSRT